MKGSLLSDLCIDASNPLDLVNPVELNVCVCLRLIKMQWPKIF